MPGIPVVIASNGRGIPVKQVESGAPVMTVAANGLGTPIVFSDRGTPFIVEGGVDPISPILMTNRINQMGFNGYTDSDGVDLNSNGRISIYNQTGATVTKLDGDWPNWRADATNERSGLNPITLTASIEYPAGTFQQIEFSSSPSATLAIDALQKCDEVILNTPIPNGAQFWVRTYVSVTSGQKWPLGYLMSTARGEAADFGTGVDKTMGGTITNVTGTNRRGYGPIGIKATGFEGTPVKRAFASLGDSILMYAGDGSPNAKGSFGWQGRALTDRYPHACYAISGTQASQNRPANLTRRVAAMKAIGVKDILVDYGNNDLAGTSTLVNIQAWIVETVAFLKAEGFRVHYCTMLPYTTGTYLTIAGQTIYAPNGGYVGGASSRYALLNDWIRAGGTGADGVVDINSVVAVDANNNLTLNGSYWRCGNGGVGNGSSNIHLTTTGSSTDAASVDGRHPAVTNTAGNGLGGHFILMDYFIDYLAALPSV